MRNARTLVAAVIAAGVTFGLFLFMNMLVRSGSAETGELEAIAGIHFGPVEIPDEIQTRSRRIPPKPPPPKTPPPPPRMQIAKSEANLQPMPDYVDIRLLT